MTVFSKLSNANVPSESKSSATVAAGQFRDDNGSMKAPNSSAAGTSNKYWYGATSKLMKGALLAVGVTGTSWAVGKAVGSATANNTTALLLKESSVKAKAGKTGSPKPKKAKAGKGEGEVRSPSILATSEGVFVLKELEWSPACGLSDEQCQAILCNGLEAYLQDTLCGGNPEDCKLAVICDPGQVSRRANRALQTTTSKKFEFIITLFVQCTATPDCTSIVTEEDAAKAAMIFMLETLQEITAQQLLDGVKAAIAQAAPPDPAGNFYSTFTFSFDPDSAMLSDPSIAVVSTNVTGPFEFVGEGKCNDSFGWGYSFINNAIDLTLAECADWVSAAATSDCWVDNELILGFESKDNDLCRLLFDLVPDGNPLDICPNMPEGSKFSPDLGKGAGPIAYAYGQAYSNGRRIDVLCYKLVR